MGVRKSFQSRLPVLWMPGRTIFIYHIGPIRLLWVNFAQIIMCGMKENKYDDPVFFDRYSKMLRSEKGLQGAGEWHILKGMMPDFEGKRVLDLGCGFGWHCRYAMENGARSVTGIDISRKMIDRARVVNSLPGIEYNISPIEELEFGAEEFDVVISSLTFHYLESFGDMAARIYRWLKAGGTFVFSVEHPVFTAYGTQDWIYGEEGEKLYWPVDRYFNEGRREAVFLGENVIKYHRTLTTYLNGLLKNGFSIKELIEPEPDGEMLRELPDMKAELRRPMMLLVAAVK